MSASASYKVPASNNASLLTTASHSLSLSAFLSCCFGLFRLPLHVDRRSLDFRYLIFSITFATSGTSIL